MITKMIFKKNEKTTILTWPSLWLQVFHKTIAFFQRFGHKMWSSWANLSGVHGAAKPSVSENLNVHSFCGGFEKYVLVISCDDVIVIYKNK